MLLNYFSDMNTNYIEVALPLYLYKVRLAPTYGPRDFFVFYNVGRLYRDGNWRIFLYAVNYLSHSIFYFMNNFMNLLALYKILPLSCSWLTRDHIKEEKNHKSKSKILIKSNDRLYDLRPKLNRRYLRHWNKHNSPKNKFLAYVAYNITKI